MEKIRKLASGVSAFLCPMFVNLMLSTGCAPDSTSDSTTQRLSLAITDVASGEVVDVDASIFADGSVELWAENELHRFTRGEFQELVRALRGGHRANGFSVERPDERSLELKGERGEFSVEFRDGAPRLDYAIEDRPELVGGEGVLVVNAQPVVFAVVAVIAAAVVAIAAAAAVIVILANCNATCANVLELCLDHGCEDVECSNSAAGHGGRNKRVSQQEETVQSNSDTQGGGGGGSSSDTSGQCEYQCLRCN